MALVSNRRYLTDLSIVFRYASEIYAVFPMFSNQHVFTLTRLKKMSGIGYILCYIELQ